MICSGAEHGRALRCLAAWLTAAMLAVVGNIAAASPAVVSRIEYRPHGVDVPVSPARFRNPVLSGFHPDPSIVRAGEDFYLVNSSFGWLPGLPIHHSHDLTTWRQIANAIPDASDFALAGVGINRGIFAPTLRWHNGTFYLIATCIDCGGNFIITAPQAAGPWSAPIWLRDMGGIDPDLFFDDDGRVWIAHNDEPEGIPAYDGHRAIWLQEYDPVGRRLIGARRMLVDRGANPAERPIWIEGPHIFKRRGYYYLIAAEGGTADNHAQTVYRSRRVTGPYRPAASNPILTQRHLPTRRKDAVMATGHADFVQLGDGRWWTVFLGTRPYDQSLTNLGRETFLLPVQWRGGWPLILPRGVPVPLMPPRPLTPAPQAVERDNMWAVEFGRQALGPEWLTRCAQHRAGSAMSVIGSQPGPADATGCNFVGRRLQHHAATITAELAQLRGTVEGRSGLLFVADETHWVFAGVERFASEQAFVVAQRAGPSDAAAGRIVVRHDIGRADPETLLLRVDVDGPHATFAYRTRSHDWQRTHLPGALRHLATQYDGLLFTGTVFGAYAGPSAVALGR
jgi:alpha-N-arabinofuranosidase